MTMLTMTKDTTMMDITTMLTMTKVIMMMADITTKVIMITADIKNERYHDEGHHDHDGY